ncbi:MAG: chromosome segregation protein SMC [Methanomethylophilus alvi]
MYLKQIELENFKSFGGKVTVPLMEGYMAVTGPNGSGKSNIADAILFVLGPRSSKAVRASRITDLIFDGGAAKSKAKFMKVSLVFDNSDRIMPWDDDTVILTRYVKLSENGTDYTSYFFINDQKSSLSEFDTLLTKARISADGYNIVQQGDVTHIVQMGNIERRRILDGISGIASFDADIDKAKGERAEASSNLERIDIIRAEKERQISALEKDREQAKVYLEAKKDLDIANAQMVYRLRDNEKATFDSLGANIALIQKDIEGLRKDKAALLGQRQENEAAVRAKEDEIAAKVGPDYLRIKGDVEQAKIDVATEKSKHDSAVEDAEDQREFREGFVQDVEENRNQYATSAQNLSDLQIRLEGAQADLAAAEEEERRISEETSKHGGELTELQKRLETLERDIDAAGHVQQDAQAKAAGAQAVLDEARVAKAKAEEDLESARFEVKDADWNLQEVKRQAGPQNEIDELGKQIMALKKEEAAKEKEEEELKDIAEKRTAEFNRLSTEKRVSESMNKGSEAMSRILALKESGQMPGIHGTVAELATVDPGYETALSVAAGNKMGAIVVDNKDVAARCIEYLKKNGLGRVTFLPLTELLPGKPRAKAIIALKSTDGYATDFVTYKPEYANVFWYVFGDTLVVGTLDKAKEVMGGVRIVTKAGELIEASGAMTGGTIDKRKVQQFGPSGQSALEAAGAEMRKAVEALAVLRSDLRQLRDAIRQTDDLMRAAGTKGIDMKGKIVAAEAALEQARKGVKSAEEVLSKRTSDVTAAEKALSDAVAALDAANSKLDSLREERTTARDRMAVIAPAGLQERIQKARDAVYCHTQTVTDLLQQIGGLKAEMSGLDKQKEALEEQISKIDSQIAEDEKAASEHAAKVEEFRVRLEAVKRIQDEMESKIEDLKAERDALIQNGYSLDNAVEKAQNGIEAKDGYLQSQTAQMETSRINLEQYEEQVKALTVEVPEPIPSESSLKVAIRQCQAKIDALGHVNLRAIEDYDICKQEYDLMMGQVAILNNRISDLDRLTEDLSRKKKGLFMEAYDAVDSNFKAIYAQLSGGGQAFMALDVPEDPFSGGLQINAKPRNGKMLRLEALSGGEKSLTALAFIFAIQEYQPSPFYVLDEVDMFLDAVNAEMVARRVKESSARTQFIQVSLRKVTLTLADHLIGVTRPPTGISRVIMQPDIAEVSKYEEEALRRQREEGSSDNIEG